MTNVATVSRSFFVKLQPALGKDIMVNKDSLRGSGTLANALAQEVPRPRLIPTFTFPHTTLKNMKEGKKLKPISK